MLDNPEEMFGVEHTSLKKPCCTSWPCEGVVLDRQLTARH